MSIKIFKRMTALLLLLVLLPMIAQAEEPRRNSELEKSLGERLTAASDLLLKGKVAVAKKLFEEMLSETEKLPVSPFVENDVLYIYAEDGAETLAVLLMFATHDPSKKNDNNELYKLYPWLAEFEKNHTWKSVQIYPPIRARVNYYLAYAAIEEKRIDNAIKLLDEALSIWPGFLQAKSEKIYTLIQLGRLKDAKAMAVQTLENTPLLDPARKATIQKHLGYILIEEGDIDAAEALFDEVLSTYPQDRTALNEKHYIQELRRKSGQYQ